MNTEPTDFGQEDWSVITPLPIAPLSESLTVLQKRIRILEHGFEPVPVMGKSAVAVGWTSDQIDQARVEAETAANPNAVSTGVRTGTVVALDIDLVDPEHSAQIEALAVEVLGPTAWRRVGKKGCVLAYQTATPLKKVTVTADGGQRVEILGPGQQVVVDGTHPETGQPYRWTGDKNPLEHSAADLPVVTPEKLFAYAERAAELMASLGYNGAHVCGSGHRRRQAAEHLANNPARPESLKKGQPLTEGELIAYLAELDPDIERDRWRDILVGTGACPGIERQVLGEIARAWSRGEYMHDDRYKDGPPAIWSKPSERDGLCGDEAVDQVFETMPPKEDGITIATVIGASNAALKARGPSPLERFEGWRPAADQPDVDWEGWTADDPLADARWRFPAFTPLAGATRPKTEFWPGTCDLIPKGGTVGRIGMFVSPPDMGKTSILIGILVDACWNGGQETGARILFDAGENPDHVMAQLLPAVCADRGIPLDALTATGRWITVEGVPLARDDGQVDDFIAVYREFKADIVVFDTWATMIVGLDENHSDTGAHLTANGNVGRIAKTFAATIVLPHHTGKNKVLGGRGTNSFEGNASFVLKLDSEKAFRTAWVKVQKMKGGRQGYCQAFSFDNEVDGTAVARPITAAEAMSRKKHAGEANGKLHEVEVALLSFEAGTTEITTSVLTEAVYRARQEHRRERAETMGEAYKKPSHSDERLEKGNIKHRINGLVREGKLDRYTTKDDNGDPVTPRKFAALVANGTR
jgi:hypothetical protein